MTIPAIHVLRADLDALIRYAERLTASAERVERELSLLPDLLSGAVLEAQSMALTAEITRVQLDDAAGEQEASHG
jgi:hypothetical protein